MTEAALVAAIRDIPMPDAIRSLPVQGGFPVPWFVSWRHGVADFRVVDLRKFEQAQRQGLCWVCGRGLGRIKASLIGPMCAINRITSEPPSHPVCARYAARACPFMSNPRMRRNEKDLPEERIEPPGVHLDHNPGASVIWMSLFRSRPFEPEGGGTLFDLGTPHEVEWWIRGREATRDEALEAIARGLPKLEAVARAEGQEAIDALVEATTTAMRLLPPERRK
ncbi:MAG TPA: hypothetical protein VGG68_00925 [Caulobacteraceae bacterium]|jgi:hypothetical protein